MKNYFPDQAAAPGTAGPPPAPAPLLFEILLTEQIDPGWCPPPACWPGGLVSFSVGSLSPELHTACRSSHLLSQVGLS